MKAQQPIGKVVGLLVLSLTLLAGCVVHLQNQSARGQHQPKPNPLQPGRCMRTGWSFLRPSPTNWTATASEGYVVLRDPEQAIRVYLLALRYSRSASCGGGSVDAGGAHADTCSR